MATTTSNLILAGTAVVIRSVRTGKAQHFRTRKDVEVSQAVNDYCPLRRVDCLAVTQEGTTGEAFRMFFLETDVTYRAEAVAAPVVVEEVDLVAVAADRMASSKPFLLIYDIPENRPDIVNPSAVLRRRGVRLNLSGWVLPEQNIPYATLNTMKAPRVVTREDGTTYTIPGANWHLIPQDPKASRAIVEAAVESLKVQIREAIEDNTRSATRAGAKWDRAEGDETDLARAQTAWEKQRDVIVDRLNERIGDLVEGAKAFGIDGNLFGASGALAASEGLQTAMANRTRQYVATADAARRLGTADGTALANALDADQNVMGMALDALEEAGADVQAARDAFRDE